MSIDVLERKLKEYNVQTKQEEINALKEIYQEIALCGLSRSNFFKVGAFQGGTCLRILYGIERFSEDLDFILLSTEKEFNWMHYLQYIENEFSSLGLKIQIMDRSNAEGPIKRAFLKNDSFGKILQVKHKLLPSDKQIIKIKLEIDINPPAGSKYQTNYMSYPYPFSIVSQNLPSLFASKCHCLFCRKYIKGRDWFDLLWYISNKVKINYEYLSNALFQAGQYKNQKLKIDKQWIITNLRKNIMKIDWDSIKREIKPFIKIKDIHLLDNWKEELFEAYLKKLNNYL